MQKQNGTLAASPSADSLARALEEYLAAAEAGAAPPREEFLARYPELAEDLDTCLAALRFIGLAAEGPRSVVAGFAAPPVPEQAPGHLGDFRIIREVGRGGMGVVYEAEQVSLGRRVALKVLPFAATMDPRQLQRFHNEARAAASLDHPNIVHVHAVGCERAVHFYAMQFIEGQTLAAMIADLRQAGGRHRPATEEKQTVPYIAPSAAPIADTAPLAAASTQRAPRRAHFHRMAELGILAADALDYAHTLGIVHRDVKPANLMVDGRGGLWVTDFGLAHIQSDARLTMTGDLVGTLRYMSPEQALAKRVVVDHRTDVYSLGATLYELLTMEPVFAGSDRQELLRQIAFEEPRPPHRINKAIPAELETIVIKAMEKNPADRYATAKELADDLRRFLADEPIRARSAGVTRRLRTWGRRHPAWVAATAAALTMAIALLSGSIGWVANDRAVRAEATAAEIKTALDDSQEWQQRRRVPEALSAARRAKAALAGGHADATLRRRVEARVLDLELLAQLEEARLEGTAVIDNHFDEAIADRRYGEIFRDFQLDWDAGSPEEVGTRIADSSVAVELAAFLDGWAMLSYRLRPHSDLQWKRLLDIARIADPDIWRTQLRDALAREDCPALLSLTSSDRTEQLRPWTLSAVAHMLRETGNGQSIEALLRKAVNRYADDFWINQELAFVVRRPKRSGGQWIRAEEAIPFLRVSVALRPQSPGARLNLGIALRDKGDLEGAIAEHREAIRLKNDYAAAHHGLGISLFRKGDVDGANAAVRQAIRYKKDDDGALSDLSVGLLAKGDVSGAIAACREAIGINRDRADAYFNLGNALDARGDLGGAIDAYREAIRLKNDYAEANCNLGHDLRRKGQFAEALTHLRRGHELGTKQPGWSYPSAEWVRDAERMVALDHKLPAILRGEEARPADAAEGLALGQMCYDRAWHAAAARFWGDALAADPKLAENLKPRSPQYRYDAACAAALAGCGLGNDDPSPDDAAKEKLRRQAVDWLRADMAAYARLLTSTDPQALAQVRRWLQHWQQDADFRGVRGGDALGKLPEAERKEWEKLWAGIAEFLAITLDPKDAKAHDSLGNALHDDRKELDAAIVQRRGAIALAPKFAKAHYNLGNALRNNQEFDAAIAEFKEAIRLDKDDPAAHNNLGSALQDKGDMDGAVAAYRQAIILDPKSALPHYNVGNTLSATGDLEGAIAEYRQAIALDPKHVSAHFNLANRLNGSGQREEAIAEYRKAIELDPNHAKGHGALGKALLNLGRLTESRTETRRCLELLSPRDPLRQPISKQLEQCERLLELDGNLPAILSGKEQAADARERAEYADLCQKKHLYAAAARLYQEAIGGSPDLVASPANGLRYNAACAAALAGRGAGEDASKLTDTERVEFRKQTLDWLRAELDAWRALLDKDPATFRPAVGEQMRHWQNDTDFNGVRGKDALDKLPEAERKEWQKLWADFAEFLAKVRDTQVSKPQGKEK